MVTKTRTQSITSTKIAVAVVLLAGAAIAAYAAAPLAGSRGYTDVFVQCYDGYSMTDDGAITEITFASGTMYTTTLGCQPARTWKRVAQDFCSGHTNGAKNGVNTYKLQSKCTIDADPYGYGYDHADEKSSESTKKSSKKK